MDHWTSTKYLTSTGLPIDAVIGPTYPYAGIIPGKLKYFGYTPFANVLDYSVGVIPITFADKEVDIYSSDFKPLSTFDSEVREDCEFSNGFAGFEISSLTRIPQMTLVYNMARLLGFSRHSAPSLRIAPGSTSKTCNMQTSAKANMKPVE